ncbi:hypothetical protein V6Z11_D04G108300 [Gossypium hirsutum]
MKSLTPISVPNIAKKGKTFLFDWSFGTHKLGSVSAVLTRTSQLNRKAEEQSYVRFSSKQCSYKNLLRKTGRFASVLCETRNKVMIELRIKIGMWTYNGHRTSLHHIILIYLYF